jgi:multiple sugar transport system permease protein
MSHLTRLVAAVATALSLLGGAAAQTPKKRDLVIWGIAVGPETKGQDAVIREFQKRHPELNVRVLSMGAGNMDPQKLLTSIVGNVAPDVINQDRFSISDWASRGAFQSLDDLIARDKNDPLCPKPEQYYPAAWEEATYEGKVYGIPTGADDRVLVWNKKIFNEAADEIRKAGLDPNRAPRTWTELLRYSRALTQWNPDGSLKRAGFMPNFGNTWLYMYGFQNNADFMSADRRKCTLYSPAAEEAMRFMIAGYDLLLKDTKLEDALQYLKDGTGPLANSTKSGYEKAKAFESGFLGKENDAFVTGKVAMKTDGSWILNDMSRYAPQTQVMAAEPPVPDDRYNHTGRFANEKDRYITWIGGYCLAIPKGAKNRDGGWEYIKFATSEEGRLIDASAQQAWEKLRGRAYIPNLSASSSANNRIFREFRPADPKFAAVLGKYVEMMPVGRIRPATFAGQVLWNEHVKAMETALYKKAKPKDALLVAQANVQRDLDDFFDKDKRPIFDLATPLALAGGLVGLGLIGFAFWFTTRKFGRLERSEAKWAYLFVSPWVFGFLLLTLGPMLASLLFSFAQYDVLNPARFVGLKNYQDMAGVGKGPILKALGNAVYMAGLGVPLGLMTGLAVALLLNTAARGMRMYRTFFYMPAIVPTTAAAVLWTWVLTPDPNKGLINSYWVHTITPWLGVAPPAWIQSADWAKNGLVVMGIWGAGSGMILWLAGLKGVSPSLYEASDIDGATPWKQFWSVTFPMLSPIIFFNTVMGFIGAMQEFDRQYIMRPSSDGPIGPDDSMLTPVYHLFQNGFSFFKMGYASSLAWMIFSIILVITFVQFRLAPRWVHNEVDR